MAEPRRLCYICEATAGGVRKQLRLLLECFTCSEEGFAVSALLGDRGEPGFRAEVDLLRARGVAIEILPELQRPLCLRRDAAAYRRLRLRLGELAPHIVHTHSAKAGFLGRLAAHACGVPRILHTAHVFPFQWARGLAGAAYLGLERFAARRCTALICVGEDQRAEALRRGLAPPEKLLVIRNGVPIPEPLPEANVAAFRRDMELPPGALVVGLVGRLAPQKGVGDFLRAAARVLAAGAAPAPVFVLVGGGPLENEVRARAAQLGLGPDRLRFLGHLEAAEALYPVFDVLVLSSYYEGLPYVLLEAQARGVPVVATDVLGSREVVRHGETGLLARPGDPADLAARISELLADPALRARLGAAGRARVEAEFSLAQFLEGHRKLYAAE